MTVRQVKSAITRGEWVLRMGRPTVTPIYRGRPLTEFQQKRFNGILPITRKYLRSRKTVYDLAAELGVTYQRVEQILKVGIAYLIESGALAPLKAGCGGSDGRP